MDGIDRLPPEFPPDFHTGLGETLPDGVFRESGKLQSGSDPQLIEIVCRGMGLGEIFISRIANVDVEDLCPDCREELGTMNLMGFKP